MMQQTTFTIIGKPVGKARPRVTMHGTYTPQKTKDYERLVQFEYNRQCKGISFEERQIQVEITANFPIPKSKPKKTRLEMLAGQIRPTVKPDCDNVSKIILDALNGVAFKDDSQVVGLWIEKWYVPESESCVIVTIKEV